MRTQIDRILEWGVPLEYAGTDWMAHIQNECIQAEEEVTALKAALVELLEDLEQGAIPNDLAPYRAIISPPPEAGG
jgi:hypothetical protein